MMVSWDYYAYLHLNSLGQIIEKLQWKQDKRQTKEVTHQAFQIEPRQAYFLCEAYGLKCKEYIRGEWKRDLCLKHYRIPQELGFIPEVSIINYMPSLSFILHLPFQLQKPYLSKDDCDFYLNDNPLRKEKIWQAPMIASTSWKGSLRAAIRLVWHCGDDDEVITRLLGSPQENEEKQAGRLYFFPTFFERIGFEVINPHDRKTGTGMRPISMECVPAGAKGQFLILYMFFGPSGVSETDKYHQVAQDLEAVAEGVHAMLMTYGFGAKTSSGFGIAEDKLTGDGKLAIRVCLDEEVTSTITPPVTNFSFSTLSELCFLAKRLAKQLREKGDKG